MVRQWVHGVRGMLGSARVLSTSTQIAMDSRNCISSYAHPDDAVRRSDQSITARANHHRPHQLALTTTDLFLMQTVSPRVVNAIDYKNE